MKVRRIGVHGWRAAALGATVTVAVAAGFDWAWVEIVHIWL